MPQAASALTLTADQQVTTGLFCGSTFATLTSRIRSVLIAHTAEEGLRVFQEQNVDLVMSDHFLRDKRGTALAEEMKRLKPNVPVMILSGAAEVPEEIENADNFLTKLETIPLMLEEIARLLRVHRTVKAEGPP